MTPPSFGGYPRKRGGTPPFPGKQGVPPVFRGTPQIWGGTPKGGAGGGLGRPPCPPRIDPWIGVDSGVPQGHPGYPNLGAGEAPRSTLGEGAPQGRFLGTRGRPGYPGIGGTQGGGTNVYYLNS